MSTKAGFAESFDKTKIFYSSQGEGIPLAFTYGVTCGMYHFKYQTAHFQNQYQVIQYDYRGHNSSETSDNLENLSIEGCARDLKAVLDKLKIEKAILVGHSLGVSVNIKFWELFPERVKALVLICGGITNPFDMMLYTDMTKILFELLKMAYLKYPKQAEMTWKNIPDPLSHTLVSFLGYNKLLAQKQDIQMYVEGVKKHPLQTFLYFMQDYSKFDGTKICETITCPTLIIAGQYDLITPLKHIKKVHKLIKTSELFVAPQGSHVSQWDIPEVINLRMEKFLTNLKQ